MSWHLRRRTFSFFSYTKDQWLMLVLVVGSLGWLAFYNVELASAKARDWQRREQVKQIYNTLEKGYLIDNQAFPPDSSEWEMRGCGDAICPVENGQGAVCAWGSDRPRWALTCSGMTYLDLEPIPDNPQTVGGDRMRYKRLSNQEMVLEVCVEQADSPESFPLANSLIGWTKNDCPSGSILIWPEKARKN